MKGELFCSVFIRVEVSEKGACWYIYLQLIGVIMGSYLCININFYTQSIDCVNIYGCLEY